MTFFPPDRYRLWKTVLQAGVAERATAAAVGTQLARIHAATARRDDVAARFPTDAIFHDIRLEPYLLATARAHPPLAGRWAGWSGGPPPPSWRWSMATSARRISCWGRTGRCSSTPSARGMATRPSTSPSASTICCSNACGRPPRRRGFLGCYDALADSYLDGVTWEPRRQLEARAAALLPALFLARIDGKSPVEYVTDGGRQGAGAAGGGRVSGGAGRDPGRRSARPGRWSWAYERQRRSRR